MYAREAKASLYISHGQKYCESRVTYSSIVDVSIQLHFDMAEGNGGLMYHWGDLIHDHVGRLDRFKPSQQRRSFFPGLITIV